MAQIPRGYRSVQLVLRSTGDGSVEALLIKTDGPTARPVTISLANFLGDLEAPEDWPEHLRFGAQQLQRMMENERAAL